MKINLCKLLLLSSLIICFSGDPVLSSVTDLSTLNALETRLFNQTFPNDSIDERLNRIEKVIYGVSSGESEDYRIEKLSAFAKNPKEQKYNTEKKESINEQDTESATDYPIITQLEKFNFQQDFRNENIYSRLNRLENKVFGASFPQESLYNRVEKLKSASNVDNEKMSDNPQDAAILANLNTLELSILNQTYENESIARRLTRLENKAFGAAQWGTPESRLAKLNQNIENSFSYTVPHNIYPNIAGMTQNYSNTTTVTPTTRDTIWSLAKTILYTFLTGSSYGGYGSYSDPFSYPYSYNRSSTTNFGAGGHILP